MEAIVGGSGFIGSNLLRKIPHLREISRDFLKGSEVIKVDRLFVAAPTSLKWRVNIEPLEDLGNILEMVAGIARSIDSAEIVLFSTIDVYKDVSSATESSQTLIDNSYGGNRRQLEIALGEVQANLRICRIGGVFGSNLRKNLLFDLKNNRIDQLQNYNIGSVFQYLSIEKVLEIAIRSNTSLLNVVGPPLKILEISPETSNLFSTTGSPIEYGVRSLTTKSGYFDEKDNVLKEIWEFINAN